MLRETLQPLAADVLDWPDDLARALAQEPQVSLSAWARERGLAAETLSRGFQRTFGVSPKRFRFEHRTRRALRGLIDGDAPLAFVALDAGFADQAHMGHAVVEFTGWAPGAWRRASSGDKTAA
jgi:AraC-like DNA-binding protein